MKTIVSAVFGFLIGCAAPGGGDDGRLGAYGDSCLRTADCEAPLRCLGNVCTTEAGMPGDTAQSSGEVGETPLAGLDTISLDSAETSGPGDEGPTLVEPGEIDLDVAEQVLEEFLTADIPEPDDPGPAPDLPQPDDTNLNPFGECEGVGIQSAWTGTFSGLIHYEVPFPIPGAPSEGDIPVLGTLDFEVQCIEQKLIVVGDMDGTALDQYPFTLHLSGGFNPKDGLLKAKMTDGAVALFDLGTGTIDVLFEGDFEGTLDDPDSFVGSWDGYSTGTNPAGIPGTATGAGGWTAEAVL